MDNAVAIQHVEKVMAIGVIVTGSRITRVVDYAVGTDGLRIDWHVVGYKVQAVTSIAGGM
jgi:hypothetical protein